MNLSKIVSLWEQAYHERSEYDWSLWNMAHETFNQTNKALLESLQETTGKDMRLAEVVPPFLTHNPTGQVKAYLSLEDIHQGYERAVDQKNPNSDGFYTFDENLAHSDKVTKYQERTSSPPVILNNFTEIFPIQNAMQVTIEDESGVEMVVAQFALIDKAAEYRKGYPQGQVFWIEASNYFPVPTKATDNTHPDAPNPTDPTDYYTASWHSFKQTKIRVSRAIVRGDKKGDILRDTSLMFAKNKRWWEQPHGTIFDSQLHYMVVYDTGYNNLKTAPSFAPQGTANDLVLDNFEEVRSANSEAASLGFSLILQHHRKSISSQMYDNFTSQHVVVKDTWIKNRPNSTYKTLIAVAKSFFESLPSVKASQIQKSYSIELTLEELRSASTIVLDYFDKILRPVVSENNVLINMSKEANYLKNLLDSIESLATTLKEQSLPTGKIEKKARYNKGFEAGDNITIYFKENFSISHVFATDIKSPTGEAGSNDHYFFDLSKSKLLSSPTLQRPRTLLYLINIKDMLAFIEAGQYGWVEFMTFFTFNCPTLKTQTGQTLNPEVNFTHQQVIAAEKKLLPSMTAIKRKSALAEALTPHVRSIISDMKSNMFMKLQDPALKKILLNSVGFDSTDKIYDEILSKMDIHQLIYLAKLSADPSRSISYIKNKFEVDDLQSKFKLAKAHKEQLLNSAQANPLKHTSAKKKLAVSLPDTKTVVDVTAAAAATAYWSLKNTIGDALKEQVNTILKAIADWLSGKKEDTTSVDEFGTSSLPDMLSVDMLPIIENNINSIGNNLSLEVDIPLVLQILANNATPKEIIAIFEGNGDLEIIEIVRTELKERMLILRDTLTSVYKAEEFLIAIGKPLLNTLFASTAQEAIDSEISDGAAVFCRNTPDSVIDYILERFPGEMSQIQIEKNKVEKERFLQFLRNFEEALDGEVENFLFDDDLTSLLDFENNDPSNDSLNEMSLSSYFTPIVGIYNIESMNAGSFFLETRLMDQESGLNTVAYVYTGQDEDAVNENIPKDQKIVHDIKTQLEELQSYLRDTSNFTWNRAAAFGGKTPKTEFRMNQPSGTLGIDFYNMSQYDFTGEEKTEVILEPPNFIKFPIDDSSPENYYSRVMFTKDTPSGMPQTIIDFVRNNPVTKNVNQLVVPTDTDCTPQASAYSRFLSNNIEEYAEKYNSDFEGLMQWESSKLPHYVREFLFPFKNEKLLEFVALKLSNSAFFNKSALQKLRIDTPSQGIPQDFNDDANASDPLNEEAGKPGKEIADTLSLDSILVRVKRKKKFFEVLERKTNSEVRNRSTLENAILMESVELFFQVYVLENLLSGMVVYSDLDMDTISSYPGNYEMNKSLLVKQLSSFGEDFKNQFFGIIEDYAFYRSQITRDSEFFKTLPPQTDLEDVDEIISLLLKEKFLETFPYFKKKSQMALGDFKLEPKEFLDFIPNLSCAPSSVYASFKDTSPRLLDLKSPEKMFIAHSGGFVLEKYLRVDVGTIAASNNQTMLDKLHELAFDIPQNSYTSYAQYYDTAAGEYTGNIYLGHSYSPAEPDAQVPTMNEFLYQLSIDSSPVPDKILTQYKGSNFPNLLSFFLGMLSLYGEAWFGINIPLYNEINEALKQKQKIHPIGDSAFWTYGNVDGVVSPETFTSFQEDISTYNSEVLDETTNSLSDIKSLSTTIDNIQVIRDDAMDKWLKAALKVDQFYAAYKASVKLINPPGNEAWVAAYPVIEDGEIRDDVEANASDISLWNDWKSLDIEIENFNQPWNNDEILKLIAEAGEDDQKVLKEIAKAAGMGIQYYLNMLSEQGLEEFLKQLNVGATIQDVIDNPQANTLLNKINDDMEAFHFGLDIGLKYHDARLQEMENELKEELGIFTGEAWKTDAGAKHLMGEDWVQERNNILKNRQNLIIRKNMLDIGFPLDDEDPNNVPIENYASLPHVIDAYNEALSWLQDAEASLNIAEGEITGAYSSFVGGPAYRHKVVNLDEFANTAIDEVQKKLSELKATAFVQPADHYVSQLKYGIRLVYYMPQKDEVENTEAISGFPIEGFEKVSSMLEVMEKIIPNYSSHLNYREKLFKIKEVRFEDIAQVTAGGYQQTTGQAQKLFALPLLEMEQDVSSYVGDSFLHLDDKIIMEKFEEATAALKKEMTQSQQYKTLISEIMFYPELVNCLGVYCSSFITDEIFAISDLGLYSGTKFNLKQIMQSVLKEQGITFMNPESRSIDKLKNSFSNMKNPTKDPSLTGEVFFDALGAAAIMASKTALKILKGYVETTDPAIIMGKKIQQSIVAGMTTVKKLGETVGTIVDTAETLAEAAGADVEQGSDDNDTMKNIDNTIKGAASDAALAGIVFSPLVMPFPLYPVGLSVITPAGIAYLATATAAEVHEAAQEAAKEEVAKSTE